MTFYTGRFIPERFAGYAIGPIILLRPQYIGDRGLLEHEKVHVRQFWNPRWWFRSKLDKEVAAYREQLKWSPGNESRFAGFIATRYGLNISVINAEKLLREPS
jgi:hypothetical protein